MLVLSSVTGACPNCERLGCLLESFASLGRFDCLACPPRLPAQHPSLFSLACIVYLTSLASRLPSLSLSLSLLPSVALPLTSRLSLYPSVSIFFLPSLLGLEDLRSIPILSILTLPCPSWCPSSSLPLPSFYLLSDVMVSCFTPPSPSSSLL